MDLRMKFGHYVLLPAIFHGLEGESVLMKTMTAGNLTCCFEIDSQHQLKRYTHFLHHRQKFRRLKLYSFMI